MQAVSLALAGECNDDVLRELTVVSVTPAPNASRLLVCVSLPSTRDAVALTPLRVLEHMERHNARLRGCVAAAITRKRAPELMFLLVAAEQEIGGAS